MEPELPGSSAGDPTRLVSGRLRGWQPLSSCPACGCRALTGGSFGAGAASQAPLFWGSVAPVFGGERAELVIKDLVCWGQKDQSQSVLGSSPAEWSLWVSVLLSVEGDARQLSEELTHQCPSLRGVKHISARQELGAGPGNWANRLWFPFSGVFLFCFFSVLGSK